MSDESGLPSSSQGTGRGLSMIYGFGQQSGGQVRIYSELGQGTTVCLYLPRHHGRVDDDATSAEPSDHPSDLVVDDESSLRMLMTEILADLGYSSLQATDTATGLKIMMSDARIDLLISDVGLPGGMKGRQMADAARVHRPDVKGCPSRGTRRTQYSATVTSPRACP